ncbi:MAG: GNAT family N-acetyltransferase [Candidatus Staskawiczbacteria bacterium]|nr:GNAT family N-acetyltransferase [Candidatus Staskawiczbacteria bacterium]
MATKINKKKVKSYGIKFFVLKDLPAQAGGKKQVARAFLYIMNNDLKKEPFGLLEDVFVDESLRGQGIGTELINNVVAEAKKIGCYKLVATSRYERVAVHKLYEKLGFERFGLEFKMYFKT